MKTRLLHLFFMLSQSKLSVCFNLLFKGCLLFSLFYLKKQLQFSFMYCTLCLSFLFFFYIGIMTAEILWKQFKIVWKCHHVSHRSPVYLRTIPICLLKRLFCIKRDSLDESFASFVAVKKQFLEKVFLK